MPIGNPVTLTSNVASKTISDTATASQTLFNVTGGYRINSLGVFKNGSRLQDGVDYIARDGLTVTLLSAASGGDKLQFVVFDTFRVAEAIRPAVDEQTIRGNLNVVGILSATSLGGLTNFNLTSGITTFNDVRVGGALTVAGTLTYEDTTNTNTTGIATFSGGMNISGVGATATTLNVTGFSTFSDNVSIGDSIFHTGDTDTSIRFPAADTFTVETAGSERLRITSVGNIGINTDTPDGRLHVFNGLSGTVTANGNANDLVVENSATGGISILTPDANHGYIIFGSPTSNEGAILRYKDSDNLFTIGTEDADGQVVFRSGAGSERLRIDSSGNVGINSTNPGSLLSVGGDMGLYRSGTQHGTYYVYKNNVATAWFKYRGDTNVVTIGTNAGDKLTINPSGDLNVAGITTATQLFEGTTRVATSGKAIAMALIFG